MVVLAQDLRNAVLQAAMQGKLTKQLNTDSDVNIFISEIKEEKEKQIKEKIIKKEKAILNIDVDDVLWDIPTNWKFEKLGNLFYIERGSSPRPIANYITDKPDGENWIKIGDTEVNSKYVTKTKEKITKEGALQSREVNIGDFIFTNSMSFGRPYILKIKGYIHDGWNVIHNIKAKTQFNQDYLYYVLSSDLLKKQIVAKADGGVVKNIRSDELRDLIIPIPPIEEQQRIVEKIEELMLKIDEYEKIEKRLEEIKKQFPIDLRDSLLQAAMQGKLTEQLPTDSSVDDLIEKIKKERKKLEDEGKIKKTSRNACLANSYDNMPFEIPSNWKWSNINELSLLYFNGKNPKYSAVKNNNYCIGQKNNQDYGIELKEIKYVTEEFWNNIDKIYFLEKNDVLLNTLGTGTMGRSGIYNNEIEKTLCDSCIFVMRFLNYITAKYILYFLKLNRKNLEGTATGTTNQKNISKNTILSLPIPVPPIEEQTRIVEILDRFLPLIQKL